MSFNKELFKKDLLSIGKVGFLLTGTIGFGRFINFNREISKPLLGNTSYHDASLFLQLSFDLMIGLIYAFLATLILLMILLTINRYIKEDEEQ